MNFGYITIPMMSLTAFLMILFFLITQKMADKAGSKDGGDVIHNA